MFILCRDRKTNKVSWYVFCCHGCGRNSRKSKTRKLPETWAKRTESNYGLTTGQRKNGYVENYYCPVCKDNGCTAYTVAATTRKLAKRKGPKS